MLVENFRVGGLARLGFGDDALEALNPDLVHLAISGFGPDGPDARKPGYDFVVQAVGGLMSITGDADADGGRPTKVGVAISDVVTGLFGAVSILAGARGPRPGRGAGRARAASASTVSLLESTLAVLVEPGPERVRRRSRTGPPRQRAPEPRPVRDLRHGRRGARGRGRAASASGRACARRSAARRWPPIPRFATNGDRVDHRAELRPILAAHSLSRPTAEWLAALDAAEIPCGPINDIAGRLRVAPGAGPRHDRGRGAPGAGRRAPGRPAVHVLGHAGVDPDRAAAPRRAHAEILAELGYDADEIRALADGAS